VRFRLRVPLSSLALNGAGDGARRAQFTVLVAAADDAGRTTCVHERNVPLPLPAGGAAPADYSWEVEIPLHAGAHRLGVAVRDETSGAVGLGGRRFARRARY